jgi:Uma2 family endonuclease
MERCDPVAQPKPITHPPLTFDEYLAADYGSDARYELAHGALIEVPPETDDNISLAMGLAEILKSLCSWRLIRTHASTLEVSPLLGVPQNNRFPDLMVLSPELAEALRGKSSAVRLSMPNPVLVAEVVSPYRSPSDDNYRRDYGDKRQQYEHRRIPEYWIIDPVAQCVTVLALSTTGYQEQVFIGSERVISPAFPFLSVTAKKILSPFEF